MWIYIMTVSHKSYMAGTNIIFDTIDTTFTDV